MIRIFDHLDGAPEDACLSRIAREMHRSPQWLTVPAYTPLGPVAGEGDEYPCAGWLHNQFGIGNNLGVRLAVMRGHLPTPEVEGDQHARFEDTIPHGQEGVAATFPTPTLAQTICLLAFSRGTQPRVPPPITRDRMLTHRWVAPTTKRPPGSKAKPR